MSHDKERRQRVDRRLRDIGPPKGWRERRRSTERRMPTVEEAAVSEDDWQKYFGNYAQATTTVTPPSAPHDATHEIAAEVLSKARD